MHTKPLLLSSIRPLELELVRCAAQSSVEVTKLRLPSLNLYVTRYVSCYAIIPCSVIWHRVVRWPSTRVVLLGTLHDYYTPRNTDLVRGDCNLEKYATRYKTHYKIEIIHKCHFKSKAENGIFGTNRKHLSNKNQNILRKAASIGSNLPPKGVKTQTFCSLTVCTCTLNALRCLRVLPTRRTPNGHTCAGRLGVRVRCDVRGAA
eukprot:6213958-Pleurochrysis_carterae.AAC.1